MKVYKFYRKDNGALFAVTRYKQLADEFEVIYDISKFTKVTEDIDKDDYNLRVIYKEGLKLWYYSCDTKDVKDFNICMTKDMCDAIKKASDNIRYTLKSAYITTIRYREFEGFDVSDDFISALYDLSNDDKYKIDTYKIFVDLYADILSSAAFSHSKERSVDASTLLGIYKYDYNGTRYEDVYDIDNSSMYDSNMISMDIFGNSYNSRHNN